MNKGQEDQYYIKNSHPAIIDRETFELVAKEIMRRRMLHQEKKRIYAAKYALSDLCKCGECGSRFYRVTRYMPKNTVFGYVASGYIVRMQINVI